MKTSTRIHQAAVRTFAATLLAIGLTACAGITAPSQQDRLAKAQAMFAERCKTAGEKIYRTVDNVEGIYLMKLRPTQNFGGQFDLDDPYGNDLSGDGYIGSFLRNSFYGNKGYEDLKGYVFVEIPLSQDGGRNRYSGRLEEPWQNNKAYLKGYIRFVMDKIPATAEPPQYGVTYDDISTHEERDYWIAGSSLKVIDMKTNEVIAERVGYMMDPGQGNRSGGRAPWLMAANHSCPQFRGEHASTDQLGQAARFVEKVLKPSVNQKK